MILFYKLTYLVSKYLPVQKYVIVDTYKIFGFTLILTEYINFRNNIRVEISKLHIDNQQ